MKSFLRILGIAAGLMLLSSGSALGQCAARGGQAASAAGSTAAVSGGAILGSGQILTSPGSWHYDVLMQQQMQAAMARQQQLIAIQKAAKSQASLERRLANAQKHRAQAAYKREVEITRRSQSLANR